MSWTHAQVAAAFNALSPAPASLAAGVVILNTQTTTLTGQNISAQAAFDILETSATGDWAKIVLRSRGTLSGSSPPSATDNAVSAAIEATALLQSSEATIETSNAGVATLLGSWLAALVASGDVSSASEAAILALASVTEPTWQPPLEIADLQACQTQGLISSSVAVN